MTHAMSRVLGAVALAAMLATGGTAGAAHSPTLGPDGRPVETGTDQAPSVRTVEAEADDPPVAIAASQARSIHSAVVWRHRRLYLRGDVESYFGREVLVQRKACESCTWRPHDLVSTGRKGWFRSAIGAPKKGSTFWRAKVAASDGYSRSLSATWETYY